EAQTRRGPVHVEERIGLPIVGIGDEVGVLCVLFGDIRRRRDRRIEDARLGRPRRRLSFAEHDGSGHATVAFFYDQHNVLWWRFRAVVVDRRDGVRDLTHPDSDERSPARTGRWTTASRIDEAGLVTGIANGHRTTRPNI